MSSSASAAAGGAGASGGAAAADPGTLKRLAKEVTLTKGWEGSETPGVRYVVSEDIKIWKVFVVAPPKYTVKGAVRDSPYAGFEFEANVHIQDGYPHKAPDVAFEPGQVYGPSVNAEGTICHLRITGTWGPTKKMADVAKEIVKFFTEPEGENPVNGDADRELREDIKAFETKAKAWATAKAKKV